MSASVRVSAIMLLWVLVLVCVADAGAQTPRSNEIPPNPCERDLAAREHPGCRRGRPDIPDVWYDIPSCPLKAEYRDIYDGRYPVLVNHSDKAIRITMMGYVEPLAGKVHVVDALSGMAISDGAIVPGQWWEGVFPNDDCPCNSWILRRPKGYESLRIAVTSIEFTDGSSWSADDQPWDS